MPSVTATQLIPAGTRRRTSEVVVVSHTAAGLVLLLLASNGNARRWAGVSDAPRAALGLDGVRHLAQGALIAAHQEWTAALSAIDGLHAISLVALARVRPRYKHVARLGSSAAIALAAGELSTAV